jgi:hypothetical protein
MHRFLPHALSAVVLSVAGGTAVAAPLAADHPLIGQWTFTVPDNGCVETFDVRPDGTNMVTSGNEVAESEIDIADKPDARGAYRWVDKVVKSNGKTDCGGSVTPVGDLSTIYVRFDPTGERMALCFDAEMKQCIGPYRRVLPKGQGSTRL